MYLGIVYGLGGAWLWWLAYAKGTVQAVTGVALGIVTTAVIVGARRRAKRRRSPWESISSRAITHGGPGTSRWNRDASEKPNDPNDFEAHVGGGF